MSKTDGGLWTYLQPRLKPFGRWNRIENMIDKGTPDLSYTLATGGHKVFTGWLELKYEPRPPVHQTTPFRLESLTLEQVIWQEDEVKAYGRCHTLARVGPWFLLMDVVLLRKVFKLRVLFEEAKAEALYVTTDFKPAELVRCLRK